MHTFQYTKIYVSWFLCISILITSFLFLFKPLAGLFTMLIVLVPVASIIVPAVHIKMIKKGAKTFSAIFIGIVAFILIIFVLGFTGLFNFA